MPHNLECTLSDYKEFSNYIDSLFYEEGEGLIQKMGPFFSNAHAWSNTEYNETPLGIAKSNLGVPFWNSPDEHNVQDQDTIEAIYEALSFVRSHKVYREFSSLKPRYGIRQMNNAIKSDLKAYGFASTHDLFDILRIRYFGIVSYCCAFYLELGAETKDLVFTKDDNLEALKSAKSLIIKIGKGLALKSIEDTVHLERLLNDVVKNCSDSESSMFLRDRNFKGAEESVRLTIISLGIFFTLSTGGRSPALIRKLLSPIDESLTDKKVSTYLDEAKKRMIYHKVNKSRVLKKFVRDETLKERLGLKEAFKITAEQMQAFYEEHL